LIPTLTSSNPLVIPEYSVIVTSYFEEKSITEYTDRLFATLRGMNRSFEVILVNDGSTDATFDLHKQIFVTNSEVTHAIDFFRNGGQLAAMSAGVAHSIGEKIVFIDSDLQLDPEDLSKLATEYDKGFDIVSGKRGNRKDNLLRRVTSKIANTVMAKVARHPLTDFGCTFKIYNANLVRPFNFGPYKPWNTAFVFRAAGHVKEVEITHHERPYGSSGWTISKLLSFLFDQITGLSQRPFMWLSIISIVLTLLVTIRLVVLPFFTFRVLDTVSNGLILNVLLVIILIQLATTSGIGEFLFRVYSRTEGDPIYTIKEHLERPWTLNANRETRAGTDQSLNTK